MSGKSKPLAHCVFCGEPAQVKHPKHGPVCRMCDKLSRLH